MLTNEAEHIDVEGVDAEDGPKTGCGILGRYPILSVVVFVSNVLGLISAQCCCTNTLTSRCPQTGLPRDCCRYWTFRVGSR